MPDFITLNPSSIIDPDLNLNTLAKDASPRTDVHILEGWGSVRYQYSLTENGKKLTFTEDQWKKIDEQMLSILQNTSAATKDFQPGIAKFIIDSSPDDNVQVKYTKTSSEANETSVEYDKPETLEKVKNASNLFFTTVQTFRQPVIEQQNTSPRSDTPRKEAQATIMAPASSTHQEPQTPYIRAKSMFDRFERSSCTASEDLKNVKQKIADPTLITAANALAFMNGKILCGIPKSVAVAQDGEILTSEDIKDLIRATPPEQDIFIPIFISDHYVLLYREIGKWHYYNPTYDKATLGRDTAIADSFKNYLKTTFCDKGEITIDESLTDLMQKTDDQINCGAYVLEKMNQLMDSKFIPDPSIENYRTKLASDLTEWSCSEIMSLEYISHLESNRVPIQHVAHASPYRVIEIEPQIRLTSDELQHALTSFSYNVDLYYKHTKTYKEKINKLSPEELEFEQSIQFLNREIKLLYNSFKNIQRAKKQFRDRTHSPDNHPAITFLQEKLTSYGLAIIYLGNVKTMLAELKIKYFLDESKWKDLSKISICSEGVTPDDSNFQKLTMSSL